MGLRDNAMPKCRVLLTENLDALRLLSNGMLNPIYRDRLCNTIKLRYGTSILSRRITVESSTSP